MFYFCLDCRCCHRPGHCEEAHALEPQPDSSGMQPQAANPEDRYYCDTLDRVLHPERYEDEEPWIPDPEDIAG